MAVDTGTTPPNTGRPQQKAQTQSQPQQQASRPSSLLDINTALRRPFNRSGASESVARYRDAFADIVSKEPGLAASGYDFITLDGQQYMLPCSALLICLRSESAGIEYVAVHTLLLEATCRRLNNRSVQINNRSVETPLVVGDVADANFHAKVTRVVSDDLGRKVDIRDAGVSVLPSEVEATNSERIRAVLLNACGAAWTIMDAVQGGVEQPWTVDMVQNGDQIVARLDYTPATAMTLGGAPVRSDCHIGLEATARPTTGEQGVTLADQALELTGADLYIDLVYAPQQAQQAGPFGQVQQQSLKTYHPRAVVTRLASEINAVTMEVAMLALSSITLLSNNHCWAGVFRPNQSLQGGNDLRDIGAVGYEVNFSGDPQATVLDRVDTKSAGFDQSKLNQLMAAVFYPDIIYSMDIEETGENSWIDSQLLAAANGDSGAIQVIIKAIDTATKGAFSRIYDGSPIAQDDKNRVVLGYYTRDGEERDIREIDYLSILNLMGSKDPQVLVDWSQSYDDLSIAAEVRLETRIRILRGLLGDNFKLKGYANRITFNPKFLVAMNQAFAQAGLVVRPQNIITDFTAGVQRGNYNAGQFAVQGQAGNLFAYNTPDQQGRGFGMANFGRGFGRV